MRRSKVLCRPGTNHGGVLIILSYSFCNRPLGVEGVDPKYIFAPFDLCRRDGYMGSKCANGCNLHDICSSSLLIVTQEPKQVDPIEYSRTSTSYAICMTALASPVLQRCAGGAYYLPQSHGIRDDANAARVSAEIFGSKLVYKLRSIQQPPLLINSDHPLHITSIEIISMAFFLKFLRQQFKTLPSVDSFRVDLSGRTVIVVGSNTGLGLEAARHLAIMMGTADDGGKLILACRNVQKGEEALTCTRKLLIILYHLNDVYLFLAIDSYKSFHRVSSH